MTSITSTTPKQERSSNFELLRILCIVGVVFLHSTFVRDQTKISLLNSSVVLFVQSVCNACVSIFILLSGYFSIRFDSKRLIKLHHSVVIYALASTLIFFYFGKKPGRGLVDIFASFIPIIAYKYWFISCYFLLYIFAPYLNKIPTLLSKKQFEILLGIALLAFSILPSFLMYDMSLNVGKGIVNMVMMYLIGRYIRLYWTGNYDKKNLFAATAILIALNYLLNTATNYFWGDTKHFRVMMEDYFRPFSRDLSITIILLSIAVFMYFRELRFTSKFINSLAKSVLAVYMFEEVARGLARSFVDPDSYWNSPLYVFILIPYVLIVVSICFIVDATRILVLDPIDNHMVEWENSLALKLSRRCGCLWRVAESKCTKFFNTNS